jgi:hypothetical protein
MAKQLTAAFVNSVKDAAAIEQVLDSLDEHQRCARATFERVFDASKSYFLR